MALHEPSTIEVCAPLIEYFYQNGATIVRNVLSRAELHALPQLHNARLCPQRCRSMPLRVLGKHREMAYG